MGVKILTIDILGNIIPDRAMTVPTPTGGIDLNPLAKQMEVQGKREFGFTPQSFQNVRINGLTPVITGVEDLKSLPWFLGIVVNK